MSMCVYSGLIPCPGSNTDCVQTYETEQKGYKTINNNNNNSIFLGFETHPLLYSGFSKEDLIQFYVFNTCYIANPSLSKKCHNNILLTTFTM
jgi:hypothetical protein